MLHKKLVQSEASLWFLRFWWNGCMFIAIKTLSNLHGTLSNLGAIELLALRRFWVDFLVAGVRENKNTCKNSVILLLFLTLLDLPKAWGRTCLFQNEAFFFQTLSKLLGMAGLCPCAPCIKIIEFKLDGCGRIKWNSGSLQMFGNKKCFSQLSFFPKVRVLAAKFCHTPFTFPIPRGVFFFAFQLWSRLNPEIFGQAWGDLHLATVHGYTGKHFSNHNSIIMSHLRCTFKIIKYHNSQMIQKWFT